MGSLLSRQPDTAVKSLAELVGIAHAIEAEAVRRYDLLAGEMERLGAADTAATFRALREEERRHVDAVAAWARDLDEPLPAVEPFVWRLPPELAASWDEVAGSALLTPYRALAVAVTNEERAFAYYAYIAAEAGESRIAEAAEELAQEELDHAMQLRRLRRRAYHEGRPAVSDADAGAVTDRDGFDALVTRLRQEAAAAHAAAAASLRALGDGDSAALLDGFAADEAQAAGLPAAPAAAGAAQPGEAAALLHRARAPLERLADACETVAARAPSEALLDAAQDVLSDTVARLARLALQAERRERA